MEYFEEPAFDSPRPSRVTADELFATWTRLAHGRPPWQDMPVDDLTGYMRAVLSVLAGAHSATHLDGPAALAMAARRHGEFRRQQSCSMEMLTADIEFIADALADRLESRRAPCQLIDRALVALVPELHRIHRAAHAGYVDWSLIPRRRRHDY
jgi:hypothetical protein